MSENKQLGLGLSDFVGQGRFLNVESFKEVSVAKSKLEKSKENNLEKGELGDALGYSFSSNNKFKKKGSEIEEKVKSLMDKVEDKKQLALSDMKKIVDDLGFAPVQGLDEWDKRDVAGDVVDTLKRYSWEQCSWEGCKNAGADVSTTSDKTAIVCAKDKEEADKCRAYNQILYCYLDCCRDLGKAEVFLRNVEKDKEYEMTLSEMKSLGF